MRVRNEQGSEALLANATIIGGLVDGYPLLSRLSKGGTEGPVTRPLDPLIAAGVEGGLVGPETEIERVQEKRPLQDLAGGQVSRLESGRGFLTRMIVCQQKLREELKGSFNEYGSHLN